MPSPSAPAATPSSPPAQPSRGTADFPSVAHGAGFSGAEPLSTAEAEALAEAEATINAGLAQFIAVGTALETIRAGRLHRETHATFEAYCRDAFGLSVRRAYQLIEAAATVNNCSHPELVSNEAQARELTKVEPDRRNEVLKAAAAAGPVTAKRIKDSADAAKANSASHPDHPPALDLDEKTLDYQISLGAQEVIALARQKLSRPGVGPRQLLNMGLALIREGKRLETLAAETREAQP